MSLLDVQRATALLIRLPDHNRGDALESFLGRLDLEPRERGVVRALAADPRVAKYGRSMRGSRWEMIQERLELTRGYLPDAFLEWAWREGFEPQAAEVAWPDLARSFVAFLLEDPVARRARASAFPPFAEDLLRFEHARLCFWSRMYRARLGELSVRSDSVLAHEIFETVTLEHDILAILPQAGQDQGPAGPRRPADASRSERDGSERDGSERDGSERDGSERDGSEREGPAPGAEDRPAPEPRRNTVLILPAPREAQGGLRYFEIDDPTRDFLAGQRRGDPGQACGPETRAQLVALGLCKPLSREELNDNPAARADA